MITLHRAFLIPLLVVVGLVSGCVSIPNSIKGHSPTPQEDLVRVMSAPQLYLGQESRFGGKVVAVNNQAQLTRLEIAVLPLDSGARPILGAASVGRIYAEISGFVDPADLRGHYITVVGTLSGQQAGTIGQVEYHFMVVKVTGYQRWQLYQQVMTPPVPYWPWPGYGPGRYPGFIDPWWGAGYYPPGSLPVQSYLSE